ncbi:MAG: hypothetical protein IKP44_02005 [Bacteroidaceae bacterium]|nr:hypothetical protein [Bacteroidaceae bacterium]
MIKINFAELQGEKQQYDNIGAHAEIEKMMKRGDKLSVKFGTTKDRHPYAWVESKSVAGFKYELDAKRFKNLLRYLMKGEVASYNGNPMQTKIYDDGKDFQFEVMKRFVEGGHALQYTPLFREYNDKISAMKAMPKGTIFFRIPRTNETLDYLREQKQPI